MWVGESCQQKLCRLEKGRHGVSSEHCKDHHRFFTELDPPRVVLHKIHDLPGDSRVLPQQHCNASSQKGNDLSFILAGMQNPFPCVFVELHRCRVPKTVHIFLGLYAHLDSKCFAGCGVSDTSWCKALQTTAERGSVLRDRRGFNSWGQILAKSFKQSTASLECGHSTAIVDGIHRTVVVKLTEAAWIWHRAEQQDVI